MPKSTFYLKRSSVGIASKEKLKAESLKKREQRDQKEYTVYYKFTFGAPKPFRYCTKENVLLADWNEWDGRGQLLQRVNARVTGSSRINLSLSEIQAKIEAAERDFRSRGILPTHAQLKLILEAVNEDPIVLQIDDVHFPSMSFFQFFKWFIDNEIKKGDYKNFAKTLGHLQGYSPSLSWGNINVRWYRKYMDWLTSEYKNPRTGKSGLLNSTAAKDTRVIITLCKAAKKRGVTVTNDYEEFERPFFDAQNTSRQSIPQERLNELFEFDFTKRELYDRRAGYQSMIEAILKARDVYAFSFDTGLAHAELQGCYPHQVIQQYDRDNSLVECLTFARGKTQRSNLIPLSKRCLRIIEKYKGQQETILPNFTNHGYNNALKRMFKLAGFTRKITLVRPMGDGNRIDTYEEWELLTSHTGRHSAATNILEKTENLTLARDMLGHKSVKTTEIYAKNRTGVFISKILDMVNPKEEEDKEQKE